jgi:formate dehydrogenase iron-sulfur subunit
MLTRQEYDDIIMALGEAGSCGHGRGLADFARSLDLHFRKELESCFA